MVTRVGPGASPSREPEAGVLPGASLGQDIAPIILLSRAPLRPEPYSEPGGGPGRESRALIAEAWLQYLVPGIISIDSFPISEIFSFNIGDTPILLRSPKGQVEKKDGFSGSDCDLMAPVPLSYVHTAPPLVCPGLSVGEDDLVEWRRKYSLPPFVSLQGLIHALIVGDLEYLSFGINEVLSAYHLAPLNGGEERFHLRPRSAGTHPATSEGESTVLWARQLPFDRRQANFLVRNMSGNVADDPFAAYQEAAKVMSAKNGSDSQTVSRDDVVVTGSHLQLSAEISRSAGSLATALSNLNLKVFPQDGTVLPIGDPSEVVQVLHGGLLRTVSEHYHLGERLSNEGLAALREELEDLNRQVSDEKNQRMCWGKILSMARELEIRDHKDKVKDLEKVAEASADVLATSQKSQELEEGIDILKTAAETFKLEMVMAVKGARVIARRESMREWLKKQNDQWDLAKALEQYKAVIREEAMNKSVPPPTFEDKPVIPPVSDMDVDSSAKP
ncbi:hypothetical protein F2Q68_00039952 [Brassica cretica]|uniref:Uncharacterized protein n=1 Tax=Brassica cretica TaxID=69181 RepID=A0A8S9MPM1_BRACR|nr:hypothetical protein F2Q68_00039952 [Brassica cretica]